MRACLRTHTHTQLHSHSHTICSQERDDARASLEDAKTVVLAEQAAKQQRAAAEEAAAAEPPGKKARVAGIPEPILQVSEHIKSCLMPGNG